MAGFWDFLLTLIRSGKSKDKNSVIVKTYVNGNNSNNNNYNGKSDKKNVWVDKNPKTNQSLRNDVASVACVSLQRIRLYSTGSKGKVYTNKFYKSINHNFGVEVVLYNASSKAQVVHLGHCIYDDNGNVMFKGNLSPKISPHSKLKQNLFVDSDAFSKMKSGKYKSQFWINDKKVQKVFFTVTQK